MLSVCRLLKDALDMDDGGIMPFWLTSPFREPVMYAISDEGEASSREPSCSSPEYSSSSSAERWREPSAPSSRLCVRLCCARLSEREKALLHWGQT